MTQLDLFAQPDAEAQGVTSSTPQPWEIIAQALEEHRPSSVIALVSGGNDSVPMAHVTHQALRHLGQEQLWRGIVHIDTGIALPACGQHVRAVRDQMGWPLTVARAEDYIGEDGKPNPQRYAEIVEEYGFPGPAQHPTMYGRLKDRPLNNVVQRLKRHWHDRILLCSGIRREESQIRMGKLSPIERDGAKVWCNPIFHWSKADTWRVLADLGLPRNPVSQTLHISGDCLCGAFAQPDEWDLLGLFYPDMRARLEHIAARVASRGRWPRWGVKRPRWWGAQWRAADTGQRSFLPLCVGCDTRTGQAIDWLTLPRSQRIADFLSVGLDDSQAHNARIMDDANAVWLHDRERTWHLYTIGDVWGSPSLWISKQPDYQEALVYPSGNVVAAPHVTGLGLPRYEDDCEDHRPGGCALCTRCAPDAILC
jgi:3'-phosphoadenosine 5'-phosphosulfate sulfotransferase (PAPS reductase)/FAD synthetase